MLPHNRIDFHMQTRLAECMRNTECWSVHPGTYTCPQLLLKARDSLKHISGNTVTLQCISYHYHARVQQREVQVMDIWIAGVILWHLCMGQTRLTRTLQLKHPTEPMSHCPRQHMGCKQHSKRCRTTAHTDLLLPCPHTQLLQRGS